ncbi:hypothetical protein D3C73_690010 [compost metagenome]
MQAGQAQANDFLPVFHRQPGMAAGIGGLAGIAGDLLDGRLQFTERVAYQRGIAGLMFGAVVQLVAQLSKRSAGARDLFGVEADGTYQIGEVGAQAVERGLDVMQFAVGLAQFDVAAEVALGPGQQRGCEVGQGSGQAPLQRVDQQRDQQDQGDHHPLHQSDFTLNLSVLGANHRFQSGDGLLHLSDFLVRCGAQVGTLLDLFAGALKFGGVASQQAVEFALEPDAGILGLGFFAVLQAHHRGEIVGTRFAGTGNAEQWQGVQQLRLCTDTGHFAFNVRRQFAATAADQLVPRQRQFAQVLGRGQQRRQIRRVTAGVLAELIETGTEFAFGLQQQGLRVASEFAGGQQVGFAEFIQVLQAGAQGVGQGRRQLAEFLLQGFDRLAGTAQAQGITAGKVVLDVARHFILKLLGQSQVALHQKIRTFQGFLRPPQRGAEGDAHGD